MRYAILLLSLSLLLSSVSWSCDNEFLQEPTTWKGEVTEDTFAGFIYVTYKFIDDRQLVVVYQRADVLADPEPHPLFYIITNKNHRSIVYIDKEGNGNCFDIERY